MKSLLLMLIIGCIGLSSDTIKGPSNISEITKAINSGNVNVLSSYFDSNVELAVDNNEDIYSKIQATQIMKSFFAKYPPTSFSQVHQGKSKGNDSQYYIGSMVSSDKSFRVYIYLGNVGSKKLIQELRFDPS